MKDAVCRNWKSSLSWWKSYSGEWSNGVMHGKEFTLGLTVQLTRVTLIKRE